MFSNDIENFAPNFAPDEFSENQTKSLRPFFTNLDRNAYVPMIFSPELVGALCSRTSRAKDDLRLVFLKEFITPFLNPVRDEKETDGEWAEKLEVSKGVNAFVDFLNVHPIEKLFLNPKARGFYLKWLSQYGDDSIAQMGGTHLVFSGLSQVAIKHLQDQRIGLAPLEKSTRYVDYSKKVNGRYMYYSDPSLEELGLKTEYESAMDELFGTYTRLLPKVVDYFAKKYPEEPGLSVKTKAFDTLRGLLPASTLSQVAFFGNGQAFEYMINRSASHKLGEIRWAAYAAKRELDHVIPAFLYRTEMKPTTEYQDYLVSKTEQVRSALADIGYRPGIESSSSAEVGLCEYDPDGEAKIIAGLVFPQSHERWATVFAKAKAMTADEKTKIFGKLFEKRKARWYKVSRALENAFVRFEIAMDIGAWRDLHRHRMQTQQRQLFSVHHGYFMPQELAEAGLQSDYKSALDNAGDFFLKIEKINPELAQYSVCLAHRLRFMQYQNLRQFFWEAELRSIPEGHPNYRFIEQEKFRLLEKIYPNLLKHARVNTQDYVFARRGQEQKTKQKEDDMKSLIG